MKWLVDTLFRVFHALPAGLCRRGGVLTGFFLEHVLHFRRRHLLAHLTTAFPAQSPAERRDLLHRVYRHFGLLLWELGRVPCMTESEFEETVAIEGMEVAREVMAQGKGCLVLAGHMGNWELTLAAGARRGWPVDVVVKRIKTELGQHAATRLRAAHGVGLIPARNSVREILRSLRKNRAVVIVLDQNMSEVDGVFVPFFGRPACTMPALALLALRTRAPVVPMTLYREPNLRNHRLIIGPPIPWEDWGESRNDAILHNTARYTKVLEDTIREHPDQWIWMHRRWKTFPRPETPIEKLHPDYRPLETRPGSVEREESE